MGEKWSFFDGIAVHNPVFAAGLSTAPAVITANNLASSLTYAAMFSAVTFAALMLSSLLPKKIPYALRIILYTVTAAVVYIPAYYLLENRMPCDMSGLGVYLPMIVTSEFVVQASEMRFFSMNRRRMTADIISHIIGFDAAVILLGAFREIFSSGGINGVLYGVRVISPLLSAPCGGFILIGLVGALIRLLGRRSG